MSLIKSMKQASLAALVSAGMFTLMPAQSAQAEQVGVIAVPTVKFVAKSVAGKGSAKFDWLAKRNPSPEKPVLAAYNAPLGSGSWICSPAGFGKKSQCYAR